MVLLLGNKQTVVSANVWIYTILYLGCLASGFHHRKDAQQNHPLHPTIDFFNGEMKAVVEGEERIASFGIIWEQTNSTLENSFYSEFLVTLTTEDTHVLEVVDSPHRICVRYDEIGNNITFAVKGVFLGYTKIVASVESAPEGCFHGIGEFSDAGEELEVTSQIRRFFLLASVIRPSSDLVNIVTGVMVTLIALNYINMGVQLSMQNVCTVLKKPVGPCIGFVCQFFFMPLASYGAGYLLFDDVSFRLGLFTLGCSPGGSMSNFWTLLFGGDLDLSITMTFISSFAALGMMPLWIFTLGRTLFRDRNATIPYFNLTGSLIILTIPVGVGLLIRQYSPRLAKISEVFLKPMCICVVVVGISFTLYAYRYVFQLFTWQVIIAGISIAWGGYCFGALVAWIARLKKQQIIAVSIETALQNPGIAFVLLLLSLPQPEADLTLVPVVAQIMLTGLPMYLVLISLKIRSCLFSNSAEKTKTKDNDGGIEDEFLDKHYLPLNTDPQKAVIVPSAACVK